MAVDNTLRDLCEREPFFNYPHLTFPASFIFFRMSYRETSSENSRIEFNLVVAAIINQFQSVGFFFSVFNFQSSRLLNFTSKHLLLHSNALGGHSVSNYFYNILPFSSIYASFNFQLSTFDFRSSRIGDYYYFPNFQLDSFIMEGGWYF